MSENTSTALASDNGKHIAALEDIIREHFKQVEQEVDPIYLHYFASAKIVFFRHWQHKKDIPHDLIALPRSLLRTTVRWMRPNKVNATPLPESGKQQELRRIIQEELLKLSDLEHKLESYCQSVLNQYQESIQDVEQLTEKQQQDFQSYVQHQLDRLNLTHEGVREGLLTLTIIVTGKALGDKAILSSAASLGGTLASSIYISQQGWLGALWASWMGAPSWVGLVGAGAGLAALLLLSPLLAPAVELGVNRIRSRKVLRQTVRQAEQQLLSKDKVYLASRMGVYLQLLPDLAQFIARLK